jgi:hypothetical protein
VWQMKQKNILQLEKLSHHFYWESQSIKAIGYILMVYESIFRWKIISAEEITLNQKLICDENKTPRKKQHKHWLLNLLTNWWKFQL